MRYNSNFNKNVAMRQNLSESLNDSLNCDKENYKTVNKRFAVIK